MKPAEFLHTHALFSRDEFAAAMGLRGPSAPATLTKHLQTWRRDGRLLVVRRGVYVRAAAGQGAADVHVDPLALASRLAADATLAYHAALEALGYAQSPFERLHFLTWTKSKPLRFRGREYVPVRPRAPLRRVKQSFVEQLERGGLRVRATSLERTLVDVLDRPDLAGGMEEVWRSLAAVEAVDFAVLARYAALVSRPVLTARLGYVLESHARRWLTPSKLLATLESKRPAGPVYLDRRRPGRLAKRWNLVVPPDLPPSEE